MADAGFLFPDEARQTSCSGAVCNQNDKLIIQKHRGSGLVGSESADQDGNIKPPLTKNGQDPSPGDMKNKKISLPRSMTSLSQSPVRQTCPRPAWPPPAGQEGAERQAASQSPSLQSKAVSHPLSPALLIPTERNRGKRTLPPSSR